MHGRNSVGCPVSLLNDDYQYTRKTLSRPRLPSDGTSRSKESPSSSHSHMTSPAGWHSPPELLRSESWSSQRTTDSPSPRTPYDSRPAMSTYLFPSQSQHILPKSHHHEARSTPIFSSQPEYHSSSSVFSPRSSHHKRKSHVSSENQPPRSSSPPASPTAVSAKLPTKKFPCQLAAEFGCTETFTTSGHASRHAKKHTGEKKVSCPKCPKTFARKDNMKQHLKTHDSGREGRTGSISVALDDDDRRPRGLNKHRSGRVSKKEGPPPSLRSPTETGRRRSTRGSISSRAAAAAVAAVYSPTEPNSAASFESYETIASPTYYREHYREPRRHHHSPRSHRESISYETADYSYPGPRERLFSASHALTPGLDALVIAADATMGH